MSETEMDREADEEARRLVVAAWSTTPPPGQRARVLAAISAAAELRAAAAARAAVEAVEAEAQSKAARVVKLRARRVWSAVAVAVVAFAAAVTLAVHYRAQKHRVETPGVVWMPENATAVPPPQHGGQ